MKNLIGVILILGSYGLCLAQTEQIKSEPSAQRLSDAAGGYSFAAPAGWKSKAGDDGFALVNQTETIVIAIKSHDYHDFAAFARDANLERDGLELVGAPQNTNNGGQTFRTLKRTPNGNLLINTCVLFSPHGGGVAIVALSDDSNSNAAFKTGLEISQTVRFIKPQESEADAQWQAALSGKHLLHLYTASGYTERKDIYLCGSETFFQTNNMGGFSPSDADDGSFAACGVKRGTWKVSMRGSPKLILQFQNGGTIEYQISRRPAHNEIGLNGQRYFVQALDKCD